MLEQIADNEIVLQVLGGATGVGGTPWTDREEEIVCILAFVNGVEWGVFLILSVCWRI